MAPEAGPWQTCSDQVMNDFLPDVMKNYHQLLVPLLENGVKVCVHYEGVDGEVS